MAAPTLTGANGSVYQRFDRKPDIGIFFIDPNDDLAIVELADERTLNGHATAQCDCSQHGTSISPKDRCGESLRPIS